MIYALDRRSFGRYGIVFQYVRTNQTLKSSERFSRNCQISDANTSRQVIPTLSHDVTIVELKSRIANIFDPSPDKLHHSACNIRFDLNRRRPTNVLGRHVATET